MKRFSLALWASALVLMGLFTSCGGGTADTMLGEDLGAAGDEEYIGNAPDIFDPAALEDGKSASFTPALPCNIPGGVSWPGVLNYGWRGGLVSEGMAPDWVKLQNAAGAKPGWIIYNYKEVAVGRLKNIRYFGSGKGMKVEMWNWRTSMWVSFGMHDLSAGPLNLPVAVEYAPNGSTFVRLTQATINTTRIEKSETQVF